MAIFADMYLESFLPGEREDAEETQGVEIVEDCRFVPSQSGWTQGKRSASKLWRFSLALGRRFGQKRFGSRWNFSVVFDVEVLR